jgi:hypothetical protein
LALFFTIGGRGPHLRRGEEIATKGPPLRLHPLGDHHSEKRDKEESQKHGQFPTTFGVIKIMSSVSVLVRLR